VEMHVLREGPQICAQPCAGPGTERQGEILSNHGISRVPILRSQLNYGGGRGAPGARHGVPSAPRATHQPEPAPRSGYTHRGDSPGSSTGTTENARVHAAHRPPALPDLTRLVGAARIWHGRRKYISINGTSPDRGFIKSRAQDHFSPGAGPKRSDLDPRFGNRKMLTIEQRQRMPPATGSGVCAMGSPKPAVA